MVKPSSFCTICTHTCFKELIGLLLSLSIHHPGAKFYCMVDSKTKEEIERISPKINLNIIFVVSLDKYTGLNRQKMEVLNILKEFWNNKADIMSYALEFENDVLFLDSDIFILDQINDIDNTKEIGLSPHYIKKRDTNRFGFYNGGCVWTKNKDIPITWKKYTITSRYVDQASLEDVAREYRDKMFIFPKNYNFSWWRVLQSDLAPAQIVSKLNIKKNDIYYENSRLKFVHTHFNLSEPSYKQFNKLIIDLLYKCNKYRELICLERMLKNKWIIQIPKQPKPGIWNHTNDSFRELALLLDQKNSDVKVELTDNINCWLSPNILLYDRPTSQWFNKDFNNSSLILLGNGSMEKEGKEISNHKINVKPWIFWARRPLILEKTLETNPKLCYEDRKCKIIFIGNIENETQNKYRKDGKMWENVLTEYHCTAGIKHKFTQQEYLLKLRNSKFGLCLRGFGSKCHREVELMAFGTIPIVTPGVTISSFMDPPIENKHFLRVSSPQELEQKIDKITKEKWEEMSKECYNWYQKNVHSNNCWQSMITNLLYF